MDDFKWIMNWFKDRCDGHWEHVWGIILETTKDYEWSLKISLDQTELETKVFQNFNFKTESNNWINCFTQDKTFNCLCSSNNLPLICSVFRNWAEGKELNKILSIVPETSDDLMWLQNWYLQSLTQKNLANAIQISTIENPGWYLSVKFNDAEVKSKSFEFVKVERSEDDWFHCFINKGEFNGPCGLFNFYEVLKVFRDFVENSYPFSIESEAL